MNTFPLDAAITKMVDAGRMSPHAPYSHGWWNSIRAGGSEFAAGKRGTTKLPDWDKAYKLGQLKEHKGGIPVRGEEPNFRCYMGDLGGVQLEPSNFLKLDTGVKERPLKGLPPVKMGRTEGAAHYAPSAMKARDENARYTAAGVYGGLQGFPANFDRHAVVIQLERELADATLKWEKATGKTKKHWRAIKHRLEGELHEARTTLSGGLMRRIQDFDEHAARAGKATRSSRGKATAEKMKSEGRARQAVL